MLMDYYNRIREIRIKRGKTQKELAVLLETSQQAYLKYEKGINEMPIRRIIKLCQYYNLSADYILGLTDKEAPLYSEK
ncbi:MAG: helix-turn-helix transcriptional regulator [Oscillospiraceae bacterium]|nr:helix-turn-helix transcriptional regulator [Oscillospiraceae bacterium]